MINLKKLAKPNKTIREHSDDLKKSAEKLKELNYINDKIYKKLELACEYHDYGKMNDEFQKRVSSKRRIRFDETKEVAHNVLSLCLIDEKVFEDKEDYYKVCYAVLNHHHNTDNFREIEDKEDLIKQFVEKFNGKKIKRSLKNKLIKIKTDKEAQLLKGLLHKCDYSASAEYIVEYPNDFLNKGLENLNFNWNELQNFTKKHSDESIIVIANTGMGKTEAGLLWIGDNKGYFVLPLRTAINAIYDRIRKNIVKENLEERVALLHSETLSHYLKEAVTEDEKVL